MSSERAAEIPWAVAHAFAPVLDVGHAESTYLSDLPAPVDGIDVRETANNALRCSYMADIRTFVSPTLYRTVLAVSTIEHVGLESDAYGTTADDVDGDRHALEGCVRACLPGGRVLVSVPFGYPGDHGWFRQYDLARLETLLDGFNHTIELRRAPDWQTVQPLADIAVDYGAVGNYAGAVALITVTR